LADHQNVNGSVSIEQTAGSARKRQHIFGVVDPARVEDYETLRR
jgi:hypothetical protein